MPSATAVTVVRDYAPVLALVAAIIRVVPALIVSTKARSRSDNPSHRTPWVNALNTTAPWDKYKDPWPKNWGDVSTRIRYRRRERLLIWTLFIVSLALACFYGLLFYDDIFNDIISEHNGNGLLAGPTCALFLLICYSQMYFLWKIRGTRGLKDTLYGAEGSLVVNGHLAEVRQYCLGALYESGSKIVSCADRELAAGREWVEIVAATGFWPPQWMSFGPLQLISFRGEKITVHIKHDRDSAWKVAVRSDNMDPGVDEGSRANKRNVRKFVEAWAFFPDHPVYPEKV